MRFFNVRGSDGEVVASFYLDPFSRPKEKNGGAWMNVCVDRSRLLGPPERGGVRNPVAYLICNQSPPVGDTPSLMTFREVETLFHEFGHGLQHMLTTVEHGAVAGINGIEWDAVELPSQMMENFCYDPGACSWAWMRTACDCVVRSLADLDLARLLLAYRDDHVDQRTLRDGRTVAHGPL